MAFRLSQRHIIAINVLLVALIAYFAARSINDIIQRRLAPEPAAVRAPADVATAPSTAHSRAYYDQVVKRDVFNLAPQQAAPVETQVDLHLKLLGTTQLTLAKPFAIIEDASGNQTLYRVGDDVPGAGRLVSVEKNRAIIERGGRRIALVIPDSDLPAPSPIRPFSGVAKQLAAQTASNDTNDDDDDVSVDVEEEGTNHYVLQRDEVQNALAHSGQFMSQLRATPNVQSGKQSGFTLSEIEAGSVFEDLGLEDGDVITGMNGQQLTDPAKAAGLLSSIQNHSSVDITLVREGKPVHLHYDIR
ncbi:MAG TPA: type II secretion system protein GspC [Candidatus Binataceae bacterium]